MNLAIIFLRLVLIVSAICFAACTGFQYGRSTCGFWVCFVVTILLTVAFGTTFIEANDDFDSPGF